ncbi:MAG: LamG-like jellyroll fold domain-containing protein, partial [Patescibacteria group bacterium]
DERRQMFEIGKRTHPITIDFVSSPQAAYSSGTSVTINNPSGTSALTSTLSVGDTMIFRENVGGTETVSQAVVSAIANTTSTYGTVTLASAPTFPTGGYSTNAKVFKWQREYWDISSLSNLGHLDAATRLTLRVTDGSAGANVWIDDIKSAGPYLSNPSTRNSTVASTPQQYVQYRVIFSTTDTSVTPSVTAVSLQYNSNPRKVTGADTLTAQGSLDRDGNVHLGSNNVKDVQFYDRTKDQISYALDFDGSNDYVDIGTGPTSVKTVEFWVYPETTTEYFINLTATTDYIWLNAGTVTATGFAAPIIYVNGAVSSTLVADQWQHVVVTDTTAENASNFDIGRTADLNYLEGKIDEVILYDDVRTAAEVANDYNARRLDTSDAGLVALYHFDESSGTRAYDSDGTAHGPLTNMTDDDWVNSLSDKDQSALSQQVLGVDPNWPSGPARRSYSLDFDGSADYISAGTSLNVTGTTITVDAWIKSDATSYVDIPIIVSKWVNGGSAGNQFALIVNGASGCVAMFGTDTGSAAATYATGTTNVCDGKWYHLAGVQDGTSVRIYVNGKQENSNTPVNTMTSQTTNATIGNKSGLAANQWWNGKIDEIRISNSARYSSSFTPSYRFKEDANTVALWHFDEGENNTCSGGTNDVCDSSSNGYDGAETSTPTWVTDSLAVMDNNARYLALGSSSAVNTDRGMELKITSTTAFQYRWQGDQTWTTPSTSTLSSYSFSSPSQIDSTGVYVGFDTTNGVFGDESYFLIPSWAIEQFSDSDTQNAMRGTKRGFPERSYLVATDKGVDILNADDNTLWMRMEQGSGRSLGTDFNTDPSSVFMVH